MEKCPKSFRLGQQNSGDGRSVQSSKNLIFQSYFSENSVFFFMNLRKFSKAFDSFLNFPENFFRKRYQILENLKTHQVLYKIP